MVSRRFALTAMGLVVLAASSPTAAPDFSDWSPPVNLGSDVNSPLNDGGPALSKDGRSLYFNSPRLGTPDLLVSQWNDIDESWGPPMDLGPVVNSAFTEVQANLSRDGHWLFFASDRPGSAGMDIWVSFREHTHDDLAWQLPVNLGPGVNSPGTELDPSFLENDDTGIPQLFFGRGLDLFVSDLLADGTFGPARVVPEFNSPSLERGITVRFDGLEAFFTSNRPGSRTFDLWTSIRETVLDSWSVPTNVTSLNDFALDQAAEIAPDRETLYFASNRLGGFGDLDIYVSHRTKHSKTH